MDTRPAASTAVLCGLFSTGPGLFVKDDQAGEGSNNTKHWTRCVPTRVLMQHREPVVYLQIAMGPLV